MYIPQHLCSMVLIGCTFVQSMYETGKIVLCRRDFGAHAKVRAQRSFLRCVVSLRPVHIVVHDVCAKTRSQSMKVLWL